jgi:hypothetical protein
MAHPWDNAMIAKVPEIDEYVCMAYDYMYDYPGDEIAPTNFVEACVDKLVKDGVPRNKIVLGVANYGYRLTQASDGMPKVQVIYKAEAERCGYPGDSTDGTEVSWSHDGADYYFSGKSAMEAKVDFAHAHGLGGFSMWVLQNGGDWVSDRVVITQEELSTTEVTEVTEILETPEVTELTEVTVVPVERIIDGSLEVGRVTVSIGDPIFWTTPGITGRLLLARIMHFLMTSKLQGGIRDVDLCRAVYRRVPEMDLGDMREYAKKLLGMRTAFKALKHVARELAARQDDYEFAQQCL